MTATEMTPARISLCDEEHRMRMRVQWFCKQCDRLFCGDCFTRAHRRENRDHDVEEVTECLEREDTQVDRQMEELSRLADSAEAAANTRDQKENELFEAVTRLFSEIERLLAISASTRESQQLRRISRDCISALQQVDRSRRAMHPESDPISALESRRSINAFLKKKLEGSNQMINLRLDSGKEKPKLVPSILQSMVRLVGKKEIEEVFCNIENGPVFHAEAAISVSDGYSSSVPTSSESTYSTCIPKRETADSSSNQPFVPNVERSDSPNAAEMVPDEPQLRLAREISIRKLELRGINHPSIRGLSCNPATQDLFIADINNGIVIVLSAGNANIAYHSQKPYIPNAVCYMRSTQSLLVCNYKHMKYKKGEPLEVSLVALSKEAERWNEQSRVHLLVSATNFGSIFFKTISELCDSELLFGVETSSKLYRLRVKASRERQQLQLAAEIPAPKYNYMAAIVTAGGVRVALTHSDASLALYSLREDRLEELSRLPLNGSSSYIKLLWLTAVQLLVTEEFQDEYSVRELEVTGDRLVPTHELLPASAGEKIWCWCAMGHSVATSFRTSDIKVFEYKHSS